MAHEDLAHDICRESDYLGLGALSICRNMLCKIIGEFMIFRKTRPDRPQSSRHDMASSVNAAPAGSEPSYLGADTIIEGNITCEGEIHIDCELRGTVQAVTCLVDVNGQVQGSISAQYVLVRGRVIGPIMAQQLTISKGGHVEGNVVHQGISIEQGAFLMGSVTQQMNHAIIEPKPIFTEQFTEVDEPAMLPSLPSKE